MPWVAKATQSSPVISARAVIIGSKMYVFSGFPHAGGNPANTLQIYDIPSDTWSSVAGPATGGRYGYGACAHGGKLYIFGGHDNSSAGGSAPKANVYDPGTGTWSALTDIPNGRWNYPACLSDGTYIYLIGGSTSSPLAATDALQRYNPAANTWSTLTAMPHNKREIEAAEHGGVIFVPGGLTTGFGESGTNQTSKLFTYDIGSDTWTNHGTGSSPLLSQYGLTKVGSNAYFTGGASGIGSSTTVTLYDLTAVPWTGSAVADSLPLTRWDHGAAASSDGLFVTGGVSSSGSFTAGSTIFLAFSTPRGLVVGSMSLG